MTGSLRPTLAQQVAKAADQAWIKGDWMQTWTGRQFYPLAPRAEDIDPLDIAHALSQICRYGGHTDFHYSVAEHCLLMASVAEPEDKLWALLHDATEAYVGDMVRPLKLSMPQYRAAEDNVMRAVAERFGLAFHDPATADMPASVKEMDMRICLTERAIVMGPKPTSWREDGLEPLPVKVEGQPAKCAEAVYLMELNRLLPGSVDWEHFHERAARGRRLHR